MHESGPQYLTGWPDFCTTTTVCCPGATPWPGAGAYPWFDCIFLDSLKLIIILRYLFNLNQIVFVGEIIISKFVSLIWDHILLIES